MAAKLRILVLNGPNLDLVGRREPHIYGKDTLGEINARIQDLASELNVELIFLQSNHEGELVDSLHTHIDDVDGAILNPGGLTHHSVSLHDSVKAVPFPVIEVHISNLATREAWRHISAIAPAVKGSIVGLGWRSYTAALRALVEIVRESRHRSGSR